MMIYPEPTPFDIRKSYFQLTLPTDHVLDFAAIFGNNHPVYIEVGSGKGEFLSSYARLHPEWNFIGFELKAKRVDIIIRKLEPALHPNVRVAVAAIDEKITTLITPQSLAGVFIQHPDPWPKRKHFPRRLIQTVFIDALAQLIKPGGILQISTDHAEYAQWIWKHFVHRIDFRSYHADGLSDQPLLAEHVITYYEREQRRLGYEPKHMLFEKI